MGLFKLFVSSDLALEAPFCILKIIWLEGIITAAQNLYQLCESHCFFVGAVCDPLFEPGNQL